MAYGSVNGVDALIPGVLLSGTSTPYEPQVETWLEEASAVIDTALAGAGYVTPASSGSIVTLLGSLANLYAAAYALRSRGLDAVVGETEARSEVWLRDFNTRLTGLLAGDLTAVGLTLRTVSQPSQRRIRSRQLRRIDGYSYPAIEVTD